jgi:hypothetical protein
VIRPITLFVSGSRGVCWDYLAAAIGVCISNGPGSGDDTKKKEREPMHGEEDKATNEVSEHEEGTTYHK